MVDGVDEAAVELDLPAADDLDAARHADPRLVVAVHVGAHGQLRLFLRRGQQRPDRLGVRHRAFAAGDRARDRAGLDPVAGDPDVHLRRRPDQVLVLAEVQEELIRRRVPLAQPLEEGGRGRARRVEPVARHDLEQVAAGELLPRQLHHAGVGARLRVGRKAARGRERARPACSRPPGRGDRGPSDRSGPRSSRLRLEVVAEPGRGLPLTVDDLDLVRQVQHQVAVPPSRSLPPRRCRCRTGSNWNARS